MTRYLCIETGKVVPETRWLRFKFWAWRLPARWWAWPHKVCKHYEVFHG